MLHGKATANTEDNASKIKTKIGMWMFILYTIVYSEFIIITVTNPSLMRIDIGNLNFAIVYGMGLIIFALVLALICNFLCTKFEKSMNNQDNNITEEQKRIIHLQH